jgi:hypothetical protein
VHFEVVGVSGANQYKTKPLALARTCVPPTVAVRRADPALEAEAEAAAAAAGDALLADAAGLRPDAAEALELLELLELPQAVRTSATAASPAAPHIFRIRISPLEGAYALHEGSRTWGPFRSAPGSSVR